MEQPRGGDRRVQWAALAVFSIGALVLGEIMGRASGQPSGGYTGPVLAALVAAVGAVYLHQRRRDEEELQAERRRIEQQRSLAAVLRAEIRAGCDTARDVMAERRTFSARMRADPNYVPFLVAREAPAPVYTELLDHLALLPAEVVEPVVGYYTADQAATTGMKALRAGDFLALDGEQPEKSRNSRRLAYVRALYDALIKIYATTPQGPGLAAKAIAALDRFSAECDDARRRLSPDAPVDAGPGGTA